MFYNSKMVFKMAAKTKQNPDLQTIISVGDDQLTDAYQYSSQILANI